MIKKNKKKTATHWGTQKVKTAPQSLRKRRKEKENITILLISASTEKETLIKKKYLLDKMIFPTGNIRFFLFIFFLFCYFFLNKIK